MEIRRLEMYDWSKVDIVVYYEEDIKGINSWCEGKNWEKKES